MGPHRQICPNNHWIFDKSHYQKSPLEVALPSFKQDVNVLTFRTDDIRVKLRFPSTFAI